MASAAYLEALASGSARWVVLARLTAREGLHGWTSAGSGAYSLSWDPYTHPTALRADRGLYRELLGVTENGTALTARASLAAVQANPGSYYFDEAAQVLYVETAGSVHPDTVALLQAEFVVRVATETVAFAGQPPYDGQIDGQALPTVRMDRPELLRGILSFPSGDLTVANADGFWDYPAAAWIWTNGEIAFLAGTASMAYADFEPVATMQIARDPAAGDLGATFQLRSRSNATNRAFPQTLISVLHGGSAGQGRYAPMFWGRVFDVPCYYLFQSSGSRNRWLMVDSLTVAGTSIPIHSLEAVDRATGVRTVLTDGVDYFSLGGGASFYAVDVSTTYDPATYDIVGALEAPVLSTCGAVARDILLLCGVPAAEIDTAAFDQADLDNPAPISLYVAGGDIDASGLVTGAELLNRLERSCLLSVFQGAGGLWTCRVWDPSFDWAGLSVYTDADLFAVAPEAQVTRQPVAAVSVRYAHEQYRDRWSEVTRSTTEASARLDGTETEVVETCLAQVTDATRLAQRLQLVASSVPIEIAIEAGASLLAANPGDKIRLQRPRGASRTGTVDQPMEIDAITKRLSDMGATVRLSNQRGLGALVKVAAPAGTAAWASATADERMQYAYATDGNGFVVTGDGTTYRQAVGW